MLKWNKLGKKAPSIEPEWIIVGLGNPGPEYRWTRHNVGFDQIDRLAESLGIKVNTGRHRSLYGFGSINGASVLLVKPLTYMNVSGQSILLWVKQFNVPASRVLVIADDIHLDVGVIRLREKGSSGGHNGHKSIANSLQTTEYPRLRIGVGKPSGDQIDYVLGRMDQQETALIVDALNCGVKAITALVRDGFSAAQELIAACNQAS